MMGRTRVIGRGVFAAALFGALGFGAGQAFASPGAARDAAYCTREDLAECSAACQEALGPGWRGKCTSNSLGQKSCQCVQIVLPGA